MRHTYEIFYFPTEQTVSEKRKFDRMRAWLDARTEVIRWRWAGMDDSYIKCTEAPRGDSNLHALFSKPGLKIMPGHVAVWDKMLMRLLVYRCEDLPDAIASQKMIGGIQL